jgi:branched-chain amino acid transport system substrate-binding protein
MMQRAIAGAMMLALVAAPAAAADKLKIGFISTLSGPSGVLGKHMKDGADLALANLGGKIGGVDAEFVYGDDQQKPDVGLQVVDKMLKRDKVDFVTGVLFSNVLLAIYPQVVKSNVIFVGPGAGPSQLAGKECTPYFFSASSQSDTVAQALGQVMTDDGMTDAYVMVPNYNSGRDFVAGFKHNFKGKIIGEDYTPLGQTDYQTEISRLRDANPKGVFVFYPGGMGIQFLKQYAQAGLDKVPLYSIFTVDETTIPALGEAAVGRFSTATWSPDLDNPANQKFVSTFRAKYSYMPSVYAAQTYDAINLIDSGVKATKGKVKDKKAVIAAMEKADFASTRGPFKINTNHFPIQNYYKLTVEKAADGTYASKTLKTVFTGQADHYVQDCHMKK